MISYQQKQDKLIKDLEQRFKKGEHPCTIVDRFPDYKNDNQIALTSVVFMPPEIQQLIVEKIINPLRQADDGQYCYLPESLHLTIRNIRTIHDPPLFSEVEIEKVRVVFRKIILRHKPFSFELKNLCQLPASIFLCGYSDQVLKNLVLELGQGLAEIGVPDNKIYISDQVFFGNVSVCRFLTEPNNDFWRKVQELKQVYIGKFEVKTVSLITTNCVCYPSKTKVIEEYQLK